MANLVFSDFRVIRVADLGQNEVETNAYTANRRGLAYYIDQTTGTAKLAGAATLAAHGATSVIGALVGIAATAERSTLVNEAVTILREADVFVGNALDAMNFGAPVFLSDTLGTLSDTAGTVSVQVGFVIPCLRSELGTDRLLRISTSHIAVAVGG